MLHSILSVAAPDCLADIVFVHGLNPMGLLNRDHAFETWGGKNEDSDFWPRWLGKDLAAAGFPVSIWFNERDPEVREVLDAGLHMIVREMGAIMHELDRRPDGLTAMNGDDDDDDDNPQI